MTPTYFPILFGTVNEKGVLVPSNKEKLRKVLMSLCNKAVEFVIRPYRSKRSIQQNRYYRGVVVAMIADEMGEMDKEKIHRMLAGMFLRHTDMLFLPNGKAWEVQTILSTTTLGKDEFFDTYIEQCRNWAAQEDTLGLVIPDPETVDLSQYEFEQ